MSDPTEGDDTDRIVVERLRAAGSVYAEEEVDLLRSAAAAGTGEFAALVIRRMAGEPLQHVVGWADFAGFRVRVAPKVFVPRPRTERLVDVAVELGRAWAAGTEPVVVVDLCCGTGAVGLAVSTALRRTGRVRLVAADVDPAAVACATTNLRHADDEVVESDLLAGLPTDLAGRIDLLIANVPYVPTRDLRLLPSDVRAHERRIAHDGGADGLDVLRRVVAVAGRWMDPGGRAVFEIADGQVEAAIAACRDRGLGAVEVPPAQDHPGAVIVVGRDVAPN